MAQRLLEATVKIFDGWGVRHTGLFTFAQSAKHVGLYQKFGYWPRYLTAVMTRTPAAGRVDAPALLWAFTGSQRERPCRRARSSPARSIGDWISRVKSGPCRAAHRRRRVDLQARRLNAFAVCLNGPGSEGARRRVSSSSARPVAVRASGDRFDKLLDACKAFAASRGVTVEAGVNLAREDAYRRMRAPWISMWSHGVSPCSVHMRTDSIGPMPT